MLNLKTPLCILLAVAALMIIGCSPASEPTTPVYKWKMSVITNEDSSWSKGAQVFANLVKERSKGQMLITVYPNGQLAGGNQVNELTMLQNGGIDFTYHSNLLYSNLDQSFAVISMPWLFKDYSQVDVILSGPAGTQLLRETENYGIVGLAYGENGFRQLTNNRIAVSTPADLAGLKIRIPDVKLYNSIFKAMGALPITMNFGDVTEAIRQGQIDGQENPIDIIMSAKLYEVQKHITIWNYSYDALILGVNKTLWDSLPAAYQAIIRQAASDASKMQVRFSRNTALSQLSLLKNTGITVTELTPEQLKAFRSAMEPVYAEWSGKFKPSIQMYEGN